MNQSELIDLIIELEWDMFTNTSNVGGRAACQDDRQSFNIMRGAQNRIWSVETLESYRDDLVSAKNGDLNMMSVKYARMMEHTFPEEFALIEDRLPELPKQVIDYVTEILKYHSRWSRDASESYPKLFSMGRPLNDRKGSHWASVDNYLRCELLTYSEKTLALCLRDTKNADAEGINLSIEILWNTAKSYGYESLDQIEAVLNRP